MRDKCMLAVVSSDAGYELRREASLDRRYSDFKFIEARGMMESVRAATDAIGQGTVLLSPSATSYDRYENYIERAQDFKNCAMRLSNEK
jgi:UDP-N-acetylmuramoylalanine-D-glutamate ligase